MPIDSRVDDLGAGGRFARPTIATQADASSATAINFAGI